MKLGEGVVVQSFVTEIEHQVGVQSTKLIDKRGVIVEILEVVAGKLAEGVLQALNGFEILAVEAAFAFDRIRKARVTEEHRDPLRAPSRRRHRRKTAWPLSGQEQTVCHHAEVLTTIGLCLDRAMHANVPESRLFEERLDGLSRVKPLSVESVGNDAPLGVAHELARDETHAVTGQGALAAHEMVLVYPFP